MAAGPTAVAPAARMATTSSASAASSLRLSASPASAAVDQPVALTASVATNSSSASPVGTVSFYEGNAEIRSCAAVPVQADGSYGTATCQAQFATPGGQLWASFTPAASARVSGSLSPSTSLTVYPTPTSLVLRAPTLLTEGVNTTITATVSAAVSADAPVRPSGSVQFSDHGRLIAGCSARRLAGSVATCTFAYHDTGISWVTARYRGDANFVGSNSPGLSQTVRPPVIRGSLAARLQWTFSYSPSFTRVVKLLLAGAPAGSGVQLTCHGGGCPFTSQSQVVPKPTTCTPRANPCASGAGLSLAGSFGDGQLAAGTRVTVAVTRPQYVGKYYSFTIRAGEQPLVAISCLAPGAGQPGVGCRLPAAGG